MLTLIILILVTGLAVVVWQKMRQIYAQYRCLDHSEVHAFMTGSLRKRNANAYRRAVAHLGLCEKCQQRLQNYDGRENLEEHLVD